MNKLKLYVVGESCGDPAKWKRNNRVLVLAQDEREANLLASTDVVRDGKRKGFIHEVVSETSCVVQVAKCWSEDNRRHDYYDGPYTE